MLQKVKQLLIKPASCISYQRHFKRNELWFCQKGKCIVKHKKNNSKNSKVFTLKENEIFTVEQKDWHQIINYTKDPCYIIEIQYGEETLENDIERLKA